MKISEIKELSTKEIAERIDAESEKLLRFTLNHAVTPLDNPILIRDTRKNIARLKTEMRNRQLTEQK